jgi:hypothetical protein
MVEEISKNVDFSELSGRSENQKTIKVKGNSTVNQILTIGYEGREIDELIDRLKIFNISRLIDVREIPISRKKGFSKTALKKRLENENIEYVHVKELGSPSPIRKKLRLDMDYDYFFKAYNKYLSENMEVIKNVHTYISDGINCFMCFERLPGKCHRTVVANKIKDYDGNGLKIKHI